VVLYMITEANLIDFCVNNGSVENSKFLIFTFFDKIDFVELEWKQVVDFMRIIHHIVLNVANSEKQYTFNKDKFSKKLMKQYHLMEEMYVTNHLFNKHMSSENLYLKVIYGYKLI
jgi:hypothetical protein